MANVLNEYSKNPISPTPLSLNSAVVSSNSNKNSTFIGLTPIDPPTESMLNLFNVNDPNAYPLAEYHYMCMNRQVQTDNGIIMLNFLDQWYMQIQATPPFSFVGISRILTTRIQYIYYNNLYCGTTLCSNPTDSQTNLWWISIIVILILLIFAVFIFIVILLLIFIYKKHSPKDFQYEKKTRNSQLTQSLILNQITINSNSTITNIKYDEIILEEQIGSGSFSEVYRGKWMGSSVAIKRILLNSKPHDDENDPLNDFIKETSIMATLRHPNVVQYLGTSVKIPHLYLVTEYCEKGNVQSILRNKEIKLTITKATEMALDAAKGMLYLHSSKPPILHRDFKSANLLVDKNWTVKVADFGLSRVLDTKKEMTVCGTPETCAPEVLSRNSYTEKADVYSFGIVLWEILTRDKLYPGLNFYELSSKVVNEDLRPDVKNYSFPDELLDLMKRCWDSDPGKRPAFDEIVDILEFFLKQRKNKKKKKDDPKEEEKSSLLQDFN